MAWVNWSRCTVTALLGLAGILACAQAQTTARNSPPMEQAIFAGGCFWCMEEAFEKVRGVKAVDSGYTGGKVPSPTYEQVSGGQTGHAEAIRVTFDPSQVSYNNLLRYFWTHIDPTVDNQQFCDQGTQYRSAIFYLNRQQQDMAQASKEQLGKTGLFKKIYTTVQPGQTFYLAEEYHQDFYRRNPLRYQYYKATCGRENRLNEVWGYKPK